jgi:hypothetical protein
MASRPAVTPVATPGLPLATFRVPVAVLKRPLTEIFSHSRMASARTVTGFEFRNSAISNVCLTAKNTGPKAGKNKDLIGISVCQHTPNQIWIPVQWETDGSKFTWLASYQYPSMCLNADSINGFSRGHRTQLWNCYPFPGHPAESESWDFGDWYGNVKSGAKPYPIFLGPGIFCLDADKYGPGVGDAVNIWNQYTITNQYWSLATTRASALASRIGDARQVAYGFRATPPHAEVGLAASISESGRHVATVTTPGSTRSSPSKRLDTCVLRRKVVCWTIA